MASTPRPHVAPSAAPANGLSPSPSLLAALTQELLRHAPFAQMAPADVQSFVRGSVQRYYAPDDTLLDPADGPVRELLLIRSGTVVREPRGAAVGAAFQYEAGDLLPISAALVGRAVASRYRALRDTFVLALPVAAMRALAERSMPFADFLNQRIAQFLELSRQALQAEYSARALAERTHDAALADLVRGAPLACAPDTPVRVALERMRERRVGSILVTDAAGRPIGILTRYDVLERIALAGQPLERPIAEVMTQPVHTLRHDDTAHDAALLMSRLSLRHVPVTRDGLLIGVVSERDLFALQRGSLKEVSLTIQTARDAGALVPAAAEIRGLARTLLGQGVRARQITALVSHLNDLLTRRLLELHAQAHGVRPGRLCWIALGSEGRGEQTVSTDQDNALILADDTPADERARLLTWASSVNEALDACGYPLCQGNIMARNPECCLTLSEWRARFGHWIEHGAPRDLLNASIYFDLRPLWGDASLAQRLRDEVRERARGLPRFHQQLALNALEHRAPLNWLGGIEADAQGRIDLKLQGTALFVESARVYALALGLAATNTSERLEAAGALLGVAPAEYTAWSGAFEFLQLLRLRLQLDAHDAAQPNHMALAALNDIDRRILKEAFRFARQLQQRLELDYRR